MDINDLKKPIHKNIHYFFFFYNSKKNRLTVVMMKTKEDI
jgi:hypothetical protein